MAIATQADLQIYYDWREIGDLISDSTETISALDQVTAGNIYYTRLGRLRDRAEGEVLSYLLTGGRYTEADIAALTGASKEILVGLICTFWMLYLLERKPLFRPDALEAKREETERLAKQLQSGANVLNIATAIDAGKPVAAGPSSTDYQQNYNLITDRVRGYPQRALPYNR